MTARLLTPFIAAAALLVPAASAHAAAYAPPAGKVYAGVTGGRAPDFRSFQREVGSHPPVFQFFTTWDASPTYAFRNAAEVDARLMLHIGAGVIPGDPRNISPRAIARGRGDAYLLRLNRDIAAAGEPVYVRLMSEMNGHWNSYSAFDARGRSRGAAHTTAWFRQAWRRSTVILRGGDVAAINAHLARLGLPRVQTTATTLAKAPVSMQWVPQTAGSPPIRANAPRAYWPGAAYVDWVGTDFYSKFPNFAGLDRFYAEFRGKPFVFGEWAMWGRDNPAFVNRLFDWIARHPRVKMAMYNQGKLADGPFRLWRYPRSRAALKRRLDSARFVQFTPEHSPG